MSEFTVMLLRFALFALLWLFVLLVARVVRKDIYAPRRRGAARAADGTGTEAQYPAGPPAAEESSPPHHPAPPGAPAGAGPPASGPVPTHASRLVVTGGPLTGTVLALGSVPVTFGRSGSNDLVIDDDYTSGRHARLVPQGSGWVLEDLGSTNGTHLDGARVTAPVPLGPGRPFTIGHTTLELAA
ncbi:FHA domain-containing protein FhaB/FipA [Brevibacterium litoralis]|uniref:FHA domain-containing protein FhaB/FipA n=1 Tax=Brevibacterium litoralis TaxID=3138935 RepID=UPI0032EE4DC7